MVEPLGVATVHVTLGVRLLVLTGSEMVAVGGCTALMTTLAGDTPTRAAARGNGWLGMARMRRRLGQAAEGYEQHDAHGARSQKADLLVHDLLAFSWCWSGHRVERGIGLDER